MSREVPLTQGKAAIVDDEDFDWLSQYKWVYHKGYAVRSATISKGRRKHVYMHRLINNTPEGKLTDHINGNSLDNRRKNLRSATNAENGRNRKVSSNNTSGYKGVRKFNNGKWITTIRYNGRRIYIGLFKDKHEAAKAYNEKALELFGVYARLNEINRDSLQEGVRANAI